MISSSVVLITEDAHGTANVSPGHGSAHQAAIDAADDASHAAIRSIGPYCVLEPMSVDWLPPGPAPIFSSKRRVRRRVE
jgi:LmbE family N-acetylglucosaminyl deacetylase